MSNMTTRARLYKSHSILAGGVVVMPTVTPANHVGQQTPSVYRYAKVSPLSEHLLLTPGSPHIDSFATIQRLFFSSWVFYQATP